MKLISNDLECDPLFYVEYKTSSVSRGSMSSYLGESYVCVGCLHEVWFFESILGGTRDFEAQAPLLHLKPLVFH